MKGDKFDFVRDMNSAIRVMHEAGKWLEDSGKNPSKWWKPENLNSEFLLKYAKPSEFYTLLINGEPAAAVIIQFSQNAQNWEGVDGKNETPSLYLHWLCVKRKYAGRGLPGRFFDFAEKKAKENKINFLRVDTNLEESKLRKIYEENGFKLASIIQEDYRKTALYQKEVG